MIDQQLSILGFSDKEIRVYKALLNYGPSPASTLARLTGIKRTSMYDILNSLIDKNLISPFKQGTYTYFAIGDLNKILINEKEKVNTAKSLIENLKTMQTGHNAMAVNYYVGREGYKEMYWDILKTDASEIMVWINLDNFYVILDNFFEDSWTGERLKKNITARLIMAKTPLAENFKTKDRFNKRETRLLDQKEFPFHTTCFLYKNHITLFDSGGNITGIRIRHPGFFELQKQMFEIAWNNIRREK